MSTRKIIRFISSVIALSGLTLLAADRCFVIACPMMRGTAAYVGLLVLSQVALVILMAKRVVVIFC